MSVRFRASGGTRSGVLCVLAGLAGIACGSAGETPASPDDAAGGSGGLLGQPGGAGGSTLGSGGTTVGSGGAPTAGGATTVVVGSGGSGGAPAGAGGVIASGGTSLDGTTSTGGIPGTGGSAPSAGGSPVTPPPPISYKLSIAVASVAPGEERTQCLQARLGNPTPIVVDRVHDTLGVGSHHFIVSAQKAADQTESSIADCKGFQASLRGEPFAITQKRDDVVTLPAGIGYVLGQNQLMNLELHYINASVDYISVGASTELFPVGNATGIQEASVLLIGTERIVLPPNATMSSGKRWIAMPAELNGVNYFAMTGHTHRFGKSVKVWSAANAYAVGTQLYAPTTFDWDSPQVVNLTPTVTIPTNGGFQVQCDWQNTSGSTVTYGESATQEMCFFWAYYYPARPTVSHQILEGTGQVQPSAQ